ncbi:MAG: thiamine diphosphokinase [Coriobacteriales bacterium]|jgi:thiamine pyrophosphokinase|nr:thiamine diphosphokinase [Coriobacteriales bacterium]
MTGQDILIVSGSACGVSVKLLTRLAARVERIITVDSGANWAARASIVPHLLVGDGDSINAEVARELQRAGVRTERVPRDKDFSDLDLALQVARDWIRCSNSLESLGTHVDSRQEPRPYARLLLCNVLGARVDHELAALGSLVRFAVANPDTGPLLIYEDNSVAALLSAADCDAPKPSTSVLPCASSPVVFNLRGFTRPGQTLSLLPLLGPARLSTQGLRWPLENEVMDELSSRGLSNLMDSPDACVTLHTGSLLILAPETVS